MIDLELWAGAECTVNRIGDEFRDQLILTGHHGRPQDMELLPDLGVKALRFPVLWERVSPDQHSAPNWDWSDRGLNLLRALQIRPIIGLVHHGSGPRHTSLLDGSFVHGLTAHALATARRYPWVVDWTPVNEPLTTARFSALYGYWYPHARDEVAFWTALLTQVEATRAAMKAIRSINASARLIQTDDLGRTYATSALADQAGFDNARRWMGWDLLCGRVDPGHDLWKRLCDHGFEARLRSLADEPCVPDVLGINHYLTSDRFLDHRLQRYPLRTHGNNATRAFADVEAVRVLDPPAGGLRGALQDAWQRYGMPLAVTEVHNGCSREEQLRWFAEAWSTAGELRSQGTDVRAITAWALYGCSGWNTLQTAPGLYEPGAYDLRSGAPRPTAMAQLMRALATNSAPPPAAEGLGWWHRPSRLHHPVVNRPAPMSARSPPASPGSQIVLILGATGTLGQALARACARRGLAYHLSGRAELDLLDPASIAATLDRHRPWAVINAAGWVRVDEAEDNCAACMRINAGGALAVALACNIRAVPTVNFSTDLVFGNSGLSVYRENDTPAPLSVYGESKWHMEQALAELSGQHLIVRTAAFFSPWDCHNFAVAVVDRLRRKERLPAAKDSLVSPTYVPHLCEATLDLLIDEATGLWHLTNEEAVSWAQFAVRISRACGLDESLIDFVGSDDLGWKASRPRASPLGSEKGALMPSLSQAVQQFAQQLGDFVQ